MKVGELIEQLMKFDKDLPVSITDGYNGIAYVGEWEIILFEYMNEKSCDIGIGGTEIT